MIIIINDHKNLHRYFSFGLSFLLFCLEFLYLHMSTHETIHKILYFNVLLILVAVFLLVRKFELDNLIS